MTVQRKPILSSMNIHTQTPSVLTTQNSVSATVTHFILVKSYYHFLLSHTSTFNRINSIAFLRKQIKIKKFIHSSSLLFSSLYIITH